MENKCDLDQLKKEYTKIQKKYALPSFEELNKDFQIEKAAEVQTDYLIREIRKFLTDKFSNYMRFIEALLNPVNTPMFVFSVVKSLGVEEKTKLTETYKKLAKIEINLVEVDIEFSEEREAEFIKKSYLVWKDVKNDILDVIGHIKGNWDNKFEVNKKGYFG